MVNELPDAADAIDPPTFAGSDHPMQVLSRRIAIEGTWTAADSARVSEIFDSMADQWHESHTDPVRLAPLRDALARGELNITGTWLELGAGTGAGTEVIMDHVEHLVALDLSGAMLRNGADVATGKIQADSSNLPIADRSVDVIVCVNMFLFASEVDRVLKSAGQLLWVNTMGNQTPIHLPVADVAEALPGTWSALTANSGTGFWAVLSRASGRRDSSAGRH